MVLQYEKDHVSNAAQNSNNALVWMC